MKTVAFRTAALLPVLLLLSFTAGAQSGMSGSAYRDYRAWKDELLESWREVNDRVEKLGGHRGHLAAASPDKPAADHSNHAAPDASKAARGGMMQGGMHKGMDKDMHRDMHEGGMHKGMQGGADKGAPTSVTPPKPSAPPAAEHKH